MPGPVLLVPGYGGSTRRWRRWPPSLRAAGRDVTVVTLPDRALGDLAAQATALGAAVDAALDRTGRRSVDVVGLLGRRGRGPAVGRRGRRSRPGPPAGHAGLAAPRHRARQPRRGLSQGACPVACQQLAPAARCSRGSTPSRCPPDRRTSSLWTTGDDVVVPPDSAVLDGVPEPVAAEHLPGDRVRHSGLPERPAASSDSSPRRWRPPVPTGPGGLRADSEPTATRPQLVMSLVAKFAQAAPSSTTT